MGRRSGRWKDQAENSRSSSQRERERWILISRRRYETHCLILFGNRDSAVMVKESLIAILEESCRYIVVTTDLDFIARWSL